MEFLTNIAEWCMPFLYFLRDIGNPVFDFLFETVTHLGEETVFLLISIVFFWCIDKREGYFILLSGLLGTLVNQTLKIACRVPRPWIINHEFQPVGNSIKEATGYSFPSGHTQNIATTFGCIAAYNRKKRWVTILSVAIIALVSFSRMYLGVHTPLDVVVSLLIALALVLLLRPWFETDEKFDKAYPIIVSVSVIFSTAFLMYVLFLDTAALEINLKNYTQAYESACTLLGCTVGLVIVWFVDTSYTRFETKAPWYAQLIKLAIGFGVVMLIKAGLKDPLINLFNNAYVARIVRYFLVVVFAGAVWPISFKFFSKMKVAPLDKFGNRVKALFTKKKA